MIALCRDCNKLFEASEEDAYTPGVQCPECWRISTPMEERETIAPGDDHYYRPRDGSDGPG